MIFTVSFEGREGFTVSFELICSIAAPATDSLQYSLQLVALHNDNKQNVLPNKFTCDQAHCNHVWVLQPCPLLYSVNSSSPTSMPQR